MRALFASLSIFLLSTSLPGQGVPTSDQKPLAFTHVTVIDATGAPAQSDMTVVVSGEHITALGKTGKTAIPSGAQIIDAKNRFLIPGLWDMHTHAFIRKNKMLPLLVMDLFLADGVTGIRDMGDIGVPDDFGDYPYLQDREWRDAITAGALIGPRLLMSLTVVNGPRAPGYPRTWATVSNAAEARDEVIRLRKSGADFIKVYDQLSRDSYYAIANEAKALGLPFAGHVPIAISATEASDAGQLSLEHNYAVIFGCSTREAELMKKEDELFGTGRPQMRGILHLEDVKSLVDSYSDEKASALFAKFVKNHTYVTPTLVRAAVERVPATDPRVVKYFSPALREFYYPPSHKTPNPEEVEAQKLMYEYQVRLVGAMQRSGVKLLAGTDNSFFGSGVHDEFGLLVKAGLTPMETLQTATKNAAEALGKLDSMGTIEKGKLADLVLLDANPLQDIENTRKISAVIVNGRLLDRKALDHMLAEVQAAANSWQ